eukprot:gene7882-45148_t
MGGSGKAEDKERQREEEAARERALKEALTKLIHEPRSGTLSVQHFQMQLTKEQRDR